MPRMRLSVATTLGLYSTFGLKSLLANSVTLGTCQHGLELKVRMPWERGRELKPRDRNVLRREVDWADEMGRTNGMERKGRRKGLFAFVFSAMILNLQYLNYT